jgi:tetratricopeptide (TPR) repeat protein
VRIMVFLRRILLAGCALQACGAFAAPDASGAKAGNPSQVASTRPSSTNDAHRRVILFLEERVRRDPEDITALNRLAGEYLSRFRRSGDDRDLTLALSTAAQSLRSVPAAQNSGGLAAQARATFALHGFARARDMGLKLVELEPAKRYPLEILGDAQLELGDYESAAATYKKLEASGDPDINSETRLARLALIRGETDEVRRRFANAIEFARATAAEAPQFLTWCHVQAGQLEFGCGNLPEAEKHYLQALQATPDDWSAIEHLAELRGAQKQYDEALSLYLPLVARVPRPELEQGLGDLYAIMGKSAEAVQWRHKALDRYLAISATGATYYDHHLAGYYCDAEPNPAEALKWAKKDIAARQSIYAWDGLAWALYQSGEFKPAAQAMDKALALGTKDSHLLYHASLVYYRAGAGLKGRDCLLRAGQINPKFMEFHVHR